MGAEVGRTAAGKSSKVGCLQLVAGQSAQKASLEPRFYLMGDRALLFQDCIPPTVELLEGRSTAAIKLGHTIPKNHRNILCFSKLQVPDTMLGPAWHHWSSFAKTG